MKYHIAFRRTYNTETGAHEITFGLGFAEMATTIQQATFLAAELNRDPTNFGRHYFPVPAPFAGEI